MREFHEFGRCAVLVSVLCLSMVGIKAFASYRTPDSGTTYTLAALVPLSGGVVQEIPSGFLLTDKLIVAPTDALEVKDQSLQINLFSYETPLINPCLVIEGRFKAFNSHFLPSEMPESGEIIPNSRGISINGLENGGTAEADVTSCTYQMLKNGIMGGKCNIRIERCMFENCDSGAIFLYSNSKGTVEECIFQKSVVVVNDSSIHMEGCRFEEGNISLSDVAAESLIKNCEFTGSKWSALDIFGNTNPRIEDNVFLNCDYGISICDAQSSSTAILEGNLISQCNQGAMIIEGTAEPKLRKNKILYNALHPPYYKDPVVLPAIFVMKYANPDFGTTENHGENIIRYNSPVAFYHAGENVIQAIGNDWGIANPGDAENFIYHQPDDYEDTDQSGYLSGWVVYTPVSYLRLYPLSSIQGDFFFSW
jgi:hypothetical protein